MTQIWQQIRLGKHVGFEEGESPIGKQALMGSVAAYCRSAGLQAVISGVGSRRASLVDIGAQLGIGRTLACLVLDDDDQPLSTSSTVYLFDHLTVAMHAVPARGEMRSARGL